MMRKEAEFLFVKTNSKLISISMLLLRLTIGVILFIGGSGKIFGWFGGIGMQTTMKFYNQMGISVQPTYMSCYTELIGGILVAAFLPGLLLLQSL